MQLRINTDNDVGVADRTGGTDATVESESLRFRSR